MRDPRKVLPSFILFTTLFAIIISSASPVFSQQYVLSGKILDKTTRVVLSYSNIRIVGTESGTSANYEGTYQLRLKPGNYKLIASYIGYKSDTISVSLQSNKTVNFELPQISVHLSEITVLPGENPALEIIRRAIEAKHNRNGKLNSYIFHAYTKGIVKTTKDFSSSGNNASLSIGVKDTGKLKITGIIENESLGYFRKPNEYKDEIIARKQSANTPSSVNILTGGRLLQNFYTDDIQFFNRSLPSPIADDALDYYDYLIVDTLAMDKQTVFKIHFEPLKKIDPGFVGDLFVTDGTFALVKVDVNLNDAANPGRLFDEVKIFQQYTPFADNIYMPIDYRIFANGNFLGMVKFGFELNSIFYDYKINTPISDDVFNSVIIKVQPDADKKDSTFWKSTQTIANTSEEREAYKRIDSLEAIPKTFSDQFSILSTSIRLSDNTSITGPLALYSFNKVQGHTLNFGADFYQLDDKRLNTGLDLAYGFSDKKFTTDFYAIYYLGDYRTTSLSLRAFNKVTDLFSESIRYNKLTSTLTSLLGKYDFRDYYYTKGFSFNVWADVFPVLRLGLGFMNRTDNGAVNNSDFSILNKSKTYNANAAIYDTRINALTAGFRLDFRKYFEDGYFRRKISMGTSYPILSGEVVYSNKDFLNSDLDFTTYKLTLDGHFNTFKSARLSYTLTGIYSDGPIPFQMMYALPGNIESASQSHTFRTLGAAKIFGDRALTFFIEHDFNDELFRLFGLGFLVDWQINLSAHFNAALLEISPKSKIILPNNSNLTASPEEFLKPFYEIGLGIGHPLFPFRLEFTWRLNHFNDNNFVIGINTPML